MARAQASSKSHTFWKQCKPFMVDNNPNSDKDSPCWKYKVLTDDWEVTESQNRLTTCYFFIRNLSNEWSLKFLNIWPFLGSKLS